MTVDVGALESSERKLYTMYYTGDDQPFKGYPATGYVMDTAAFMAKTLKKRYKILEVGCGHGRAALYLMDKGFDVQCVDITLAGLPDHAKKDYRFHEAPVWRLPFKDDQFDYSFSTDVLEHLPTEMVDGAIREIYRVTKGKTLHCISTVDDPNYPEAHKTVCHINWWRGRFRIFSTEGVETELVEAEEFMHMLRLFRAAEKKKRDKRNKKRRERYRQRKGAR